MTVRRENTGPLKWTTDVAAGVKVPASLPKTCATLAATAAACDDP